MFLNAKIHFLLQIALKVVLKSVFYISHLTNQWGQTEETIAHVYPPFRWFCIKQKDQNTQIICANVLFSYH